MTETVHGARDNNLAQDAQDSFTFGFSKNRQNLQVPPGSVNTVFSPEYMYARNVSEGPVREHQERRGRRRKGRGAEENNGVEGD